MKKLFLLFCVISILHSEENSPIQICYLKLGTELGIGYRWHKQDGIDASLNFSTLGVWNYMSIKALYLRFPQYDHHRFFYWGVGGGIVYEADIAYDGFFPSLEGVIGYEFCTDKHIKYFLQLDVSAPLGGDPLFPVVPALSFGIGF